MISPALKREYLPARRGAGCRTPYLGERGATCPGTANRQSGWDDGKCYGVSQDESCSGWTRGIVVAGNRFRQRSRTYWPGQFTLTPFLKRNSVGTSLPRLVSATSLCGTPPHCILQSWDAGHRLPPPPRVRGSRPERRKCAQTHTSLVHGPATSALPQSNGLTRSFDTLQTPTWDFLAQ